MESLGKKIVKLELTQDEVLMALEYAAYCHDFYAAELAKPSMALRRAYKKGEITEKDTKNQYKLAKGLEDKLAGALLGINTQKLTEAITSVTKGKKNDK